MNAEELPTCGGVYCITNRQTQKHYVGSAKNLRERVVEHRRLLRLGKHHSTKLQNAFIKYGEADFDLSIFYLSDNSSERLALEQHYIDTLNVFKFGYNMCPSARDSTGRKLSIETREKIRLANLGKKYSSEHKAKLSRMRKGRKPLYSAEELLKRSERAKRLNATRGPVSSETREKLRIAATGRKASPETILKLTGRKASPETILKLTGRTHSAETRTKISKAASRWQTGRKLTPGHIANTIAGKKRKKHDPRQLVFILSIFTTLFLSCNANALILSATDEDAICRVMYAEAASEPITGKLAVIEVIRNRMGDTRSADAVVSVKNAFEPVTKAGDWRRLPALSLEQTIECHTILALKNGGVLTEVAGGADHFQNPTVVAARAKAGAVRATLVDFGGMPRVAEIGHHRFYSSGSDSASRPVSKPINGVSHELRSMFIEGGEGQDEGHQETVFEVGQE
jgi:group I intron endonuclease